MSPETDTHEVVYFDKYDQSGAYHWEECDPRSRDFNPPLVARYELVRRQLESLGRTRRVLDVGCGDAYLITQIKEVCEAIYGVDTEFRAVKLARQMLKSSANCHVVQSDCYRLPFKDNHFDVVVLTDVIEHLTNPIVCLREVSRVLGKSGVLILTTPKFRPDRKWDERHEKEYTPREFRELLESQFSRIELSFFWPLKWSNFYSTRIGWRLLKFLGRRGWNPFLSVNRHHPELFGQLMAVCSVK